MKEEKRVDLKICLNDEFKSWYIDKLASFYLVIDDNGEILHFSEDSLDFFSINSFYELQDYSISTFIGQDNWALLREELTNYPDKEEGLIFSNPINNKQNIELRWKSLKENELLTYFLLFKIHGIKKEKEKEEKSWFDYYKEALDLMNIPIILVKHDDFFYKNIAFEDFIKQEGLSDYVSFKEWVKSYSKNDYDSVDGKNQDFEIEIINGIKKYDIVIKHLNTVENVILISIIKHEEKKDQTKEIENIIHESDRVKEEHDNILINFKNGLTGIKEEIEKVYNDVVEMSDLKLITLKNELKIKYNEYENIITYTTENLLKMSEIASFIDEISVKIHLISINAAIESARSGASGKGFAVIAREIAKLSDATKNYTNMIGSQITDINIYTKKVSVKERVESDETEKILESTLNNLQEKIKSIITDMRNKITDNISSMLG